MLSNLSMVIHMNTLCRFKLMMQLKTKTCESKAVDLPLELFTHIQEEDNSSVIMSTLLVLLWIGA